MNKLTQEQRKILAEIVGSGLGQVLSYKIMRKLGAPRYAAYFSAVVFAELHDIKDPLKPRMERAFKVPKDTPPYDNLFKDIFGQ